MLLFKKKEGANMEQNINLMLKQLRKTSGLSSDDVVQKLISYGIDIKSKTLYGYESGLSMPNANVFIALCKIYKCDNPLDFLGGNSYNQEEVSLIEDFRFVDAQGKETVRYILDNEKKRCQKLSELDSKIRELETEIAEKSVSKRIFAYYGKIAAAGKSFGFDDIASGTIEAPVTDENQNADYTIGVSGDSMFPTYSDGDIVYVKRTSNLCVGDIGIFQKDNGIYIKEVGEDKLISHNSFYPPIPNNSEIRCLGKVIGKYQD